MVTIKKDKTFLGIDPGKSGGLVWINSEGEILYVDSMPESPVDLKLLIESRQTTHCCLEKVGTMPGEGHKGAFTFGYGVGLLVMGLTFGQIPWEHVNPKTWQVEFGIAGRKKGEPKNLLKLRCLEQAKKLFPKYELWTMPRTKGKQLAICDALLLAEYCRRFNLGLCRKP